MMSVMTLSMATGFAAGWAFIGLVLFLIPIVGVGLAITGWVSLRRRRTASYPSEEERRRRLNESRTVLILGLALALPMPVIFLIVQIEKVLFP